MKRDWKEMQRRVSDVYQTFTLTLKTVASDQHSILYQIHAGKFCLIKLRLSDVRL